MQTVWNVWFNRVFPSETYLPVLAATQISMHAVTVDLLGNNSNILAEGVLFQSWWPTSAMRHSRRPWHAFSNFYQLVTTLLMTLSLTANYCYLFEKI